MKNIFKSIKHNNHKNCIIGEKCGTVTVSMYKENLSGSPIFYVKSDNESVLPVSYIIEDVLSLY